MRSIRSGELLIKVGFGERTSRGRGGNDAKRSKCESGRGEEVRSFLSTWRPESALDSAVLLNVGGEATLGRLRLRPDLDIHPETWFLKECISLHQLPPRPALIHWIPLHHQHLRPDHSLRK